MTFPAFATLAQQYIFGKLANNISATVYDDVPQTPEGLPLAVFPHVVLGQDISEDWDVDDRVGQQITIVLHIWSRYEGMKETKAIMGEIYNLLHRQNGQETGYNVVDTLCIATNVQLDPDRRTRHGVMQFRLTLTE